MQHFTASTAISFDRAYLSDKVSYKIENAESDSLGLYRVCVEKFGIPEKFIRITLIRFIKKLTCISTSRITF